MAAPAVPAARADIKRVAVMGGADGLGIVLGIIAGMIVSHQSPRAVWTAAVSSGVAELISMANAQRISDRTSGWMPPLIIGAASCAGCLVPAIPYSAAHGAAALIPALALCAAVAAAISWLRPERGLLAVLETFGMLAVTGLACGVIGIWL